MLRPAETRRQELHRRRGARLAARATALGVALCGALASGAGCSGASSSPSGSGGASGAGGSGVGGGLLGDSGGVKGLPSGCASDVYSGELIPLDMYLLVDKSGSMSDAGKWGAVTGAIGDFVQLPESDGIGVGLGFFPIPPANPPTTSACATDADCGAYGPCVPFIPTSFCEAVGPIPGFLTDSCVKDDYDEPLVPIGPLPGNSSAIASALASQGPNGGTPTSPALEGAIDYAQGWAMNNPARLVLVVLATDGVPSGCNPNRVETVAARAKEGYDQSPSVKTFVIGVGNELATLDLIAKEGGTDQALVISGGPNTGQEFLDALNVVRGAVSCKFQIPVPASGTPDPGQVNIGWTPEGGEVEILPGVGDSGSCQGGNGWYYDDPNAPNRIILCPASCDLVENTKGTVEVVLGCKTVVT